MSVMFSISVSLCRTGKALIPRSGSTQEILVLLQEQGDGHASADSHRSPEPTATPMATSHHHHHRQQQNRHDLYPLPSEERALLPALEALISGANFSSKARRTAPRPGPGWLESAPVRPVKGARATESGRKQNPTLGWRQAARLHNHQRWRR